MYIYIYIYIVIYISPNPLQIYHIYKSWLKKSYDDVILTGDDFLTNGIQPLKH